MITINLLPVEFRRKIEQQHVVSMRFSMMLACLVTVIIWLGLSFMLGTAKREMDNLSSDWSRLEAGSKEADKIMLDINQNFLDRKKMVDSISMSDMSWSYVLNQISDLLPDTSWLKKLKLSAGGMEEWEFWIKGIIKPSDQEPPIKIVGKYIGALKPSLEQPIKTAHAIQTLPGANPVMPGQTAPSVDLGKILNVQTSIDQEIVNNAMLISFEGTFLLKAKKDESIRNRPKTA